MRTLSLLSLGVVLQVAAPAFAQHADGDGHGIGIGVEQNLGGFTGAALSYDAGRFHVDGLMGLAHFNQPGDDLDVFGVGGRFFFKVHEMPGADLSLGGGVALILSDVGDFSDTTIHLEAAAKIRVWLVPNVAFSGSLGLAILRADDGRVMGGPVGGGQAANSIYGIGGQLSGALGILYHFR